jgi:hypothetical protein
MKTMVMIISVTLFSWLGWWLAEGAGLMVAYSASVVGSLIGVYVAVRITRACLGE